jgi:hypothetical protein
MYWEKKTHKEGTFAAVTKSSDNYSNHNGLGGYDKNQRCQQNVHVRPQKLHIYEHSNTRQKERCKKISNWLHLQNAPIHTLLTLAIQEAQQ